MAVRSGVRACRFTPLSADANGRTRAALRATAWRPARRLRTRQADRHPSQGQREGSLDQACASARQTAYRPVMAASAAFTLRQLLRPRPRRASTCRGSPAAAPAPRLLFFNAPAGRGARPRRRRAGGRQRRRALRRQHAARRRRAARAGLRRPPVRRLLAAARRRPRAAARRGDRPRTGGAATSRSRARAARRSRAAATARPRSGRCCARC